MYSIQIASPFTLENGEIIENLTIGFHIYGTLNPKKDNVVWVCHALTANSDVVDWWDGLFGAEKLFDAMAQLAQQVHLKIAARY
jgi:homoserine O-acetyltransferase